jgi:hypothetical protein
MAGITINFPSAEEEELIRRFTVNRNYLQALAGFLTTTYGQPEHLYSGLQHAVAARPSFTKIQRSSADLAEIRRFLTLAWTSEIQLHLPAIMGNEAMIGFANAWAPVHGYYGVFGGLQAWFTANGMVGVADDHTATLKTIATMIEQRDLFPEPWNLLAAGCPMRGERQYLNDRGVDCTSHVEVLSAPTMSGVDPTFWPRYGTWLRSTREARLLKREEDWKHKERKSRIPPAQRTKFARSLAPTSLFDCFWRMRIKSNYGTIDPYLIARITARDHEIFNSSLCMVTRATLALLELYAMRRIGRVDFGQIASDFVKQDGAELSKDTLQARLQAFGLIS